MKRSVIAIGLDAGDPELLEKWMAAGELPNLFKLRQQSAYSRLRNTANFCGEASETFSTEPLWVEFATGCRPAKTGYWDMIRYLPDRYGIWNDRHEPYDYEEFAPFYSLGQEARVAIFDLPVAKLTDGVQGTQILGWGGHWPHTGSHSLPERALPDIIRKYGPNPILFKDTGIWWNAKYVNWLKSALKDSVRSRTAICLDLLREGDWDLFLAVFSEPHTVGHDLYNYSQPDHPWYPLLTDNGTAPDPVLQTYRNVDHAIGQILAEAPPTAAIVCFSLHGMGPNYNDMLSSAFLPELLFRHSFPGRGALAPGTTGTTPPAPCKPRRGSWAAEMWLANRHPNPLQRLVRQWLPNRYLGGAVNGLDSPFRPGKRAEPMSWNPCMWYQPLWPRMKAFATPGFTKGHVRINLKGRDPQGVVAPEDYGATCDEIAALLFRIVDARSGQPLVKQVARTHRSADDADPKGPSFDLDVLWHEHITDVVDSPDLGRIGPVPYSRAGGHWNRGFCMVRAAEVPAGTASRTGEVVDLAPTLLALMQRPVPAHFDGRSLLR